MFIAVHHIIVKNSSRVNHMETGHVLPFTQILISAMYPHSSPLAFVFVIPII